MKKTYIYLYLNIIILIYIYIILCYIIYDGILRGPA